MNGDTRVRARPQHVSVDLEGNAVVLDTDLGVYFEIDGVGARIWQLLADSRTVGELHAAVLDEYAVEPERCLADLARFLGELARQGLIDVDDATS